MLTPSTIAVQAPAPVTTAIIQKLGAIEAAQTTAEATLRAAETAAKFAVIAAVISFVGALIASYVARRNGFVQARTTQQIKHAEFRQKWIDELRIEMGKFVLLTAQNDKAFSKTPELLQSLAMITLRMDREDEDWDELHELMMATINASGTGDKHLEDAESFGRAHARLTLLCQDILKREWEVTKRDLHATPWGWPWNWFVARRKKSERRKRLEFNKARRDERARDAALRGSDPATVQDSSQPSIASK